MHASDLPRATNRLRQERIARNWRQRDLADQLGTTTVSVTRWERGIQLPSAYFRLKLCALFGKSAVELGLVDVNPPPPASTEEDVSEMGLAPSSPAETPTLWTVPYRRNLFFTGREELLCLVRQKFNSERPASLTQSYALSGLGGIGKTQLAIEYAYRCRQDYQAVFWVRASSRETLLADLVALSPLLALPSQEVRMPQQAMEAVKDWLARHGNWLLILDNADDLSLVADFLPVGGEGHLLLTTRSSATGTLAVNIPVEQMNLEEGTLFVLRRAKLLPVEHTRAAEPTTASAAQRLVRALGGLPLALDQAGAYIEESGCSLTEYLELYQRNRGSLLTRRGSTPTEYPQTVTGTWSLSVQQVEQQNPAAADLLRLCAFLEPDAIEESLLREGAACLGPVLEPVAADAFLLNEAMKVLRTFSLVRRNPETKVLSLHRLVQVVIQEEMDVQTRRGWIERTISLLKTLLPEPTVDWFRNWSRFQELLPHIQICAGLIEHTQPLTLDGAHVLKRAAQYLAISFTSLTLAERLSRLALDIYEQQGLIEHPDAASLFNSLGHISWSRGRFDQALSLHQRALDIRQRVRGTDHPETANSYNNLGLVHWALAHYDQAEAMYRQALTYYEHALGPEHVSTVPTLQNLGVLFLNLQCYEQAESFHQRALAILERDRESHHPLRAQSDWNIAFGLSGLGEVYAAQGRDDEAEVLFRQALALYEQRLGMNGIMVGPTVSHLAELYQRQGRFGEAEVAFHRALAIFEQEPGSDHPQIARVVANFARFSAAQGRNEEARSLYQRALAMCERSLGNNHPETITVRETYTAWLRQKAHP